MSAPIPEPDDPTPIDPVEDPELDQSRGDNPLERDSSKEGVWSPGDASGDVTGSGKNGRDVREDDYRRDSGSSGGNR